MTDSLVQSVESSARSSHPVSCLSDICRPETHSKLTAAVAVVHPHKVSAAQLPTDSYQTSSSQLSKMHASSDCAPAPFSHDPLAQETNSACDYTIRITLEMAKAGLAPRAIRIYADGVYDMFHSGHARQLMQAKRAFPNAYLIVGVCNDADVHRYKGRTVMNEAERYEAVRHCRYVDEVVTDAPWTISQEFLLKHKIDFVAHDDIPYASSQSEDVYKPIKDAGMFVVTQRTEGISTTDVIGRIVRDYDIYLRRNLRRGLSRKDLNISYVKEKKLKFQDNFETIVKQGSNFIKNVDSKRRELIDHLEDKSQEVFRSFMHFFGADGHLRNWFNNRMHALTDAEDGTLSPSSSTSEASRTFDEDSATSSPAAEDLCVHVCGDGERQFRISMQPHMFDKRKRPASADWKHHNLADQLTVANRFDTTAQYPKTRRLASSGSDAAHAASPRSSLNAYRRSCSKKCAK